jgi:hypothetical protein
MKQRTIGGGLLVIKRNNRTIGGGRPLFKKKEKIEQSEGGVSVGK